jgi:hypothetical protein
LVTGGSPKTTLPREGNDGQGGGGGNRGVRGDKGRARAVPHSTRRGARARRKGTRQAGKKLLHASPARRTSARALREWVRCRYRLYCRAPPPDSHARRKATLSWAPGRPEVAACLPPVVSCPPCLGQGERARCAASQRFVRPCRASVTRGPASKATMSGRGRRGGFGRGRWRRGGEWTTRDEWQARNLR